jgi:hypothetical protein
MSILKSAGIASGITPMHLKEPTDEDSALEWFEQLDYAIGHGTNFALGEPTSERDSFGDVVQIDRSRETIRQTLLELRMVDLLPNLVVASLKKSFGSKFDTLGQNERLTLAAAASERVVTHARVREMTALHPFDLTRMLQDLVRDGFLEAHNQGRGAVYCLPGASLPRPEEVFGDGSEQSDSSSAQLIHHSAHLEEDTIANEYRDAEGRLLADLLDAPVIDSLDKLIPSFLAELENLAVEPRTKGKLPAETMKEVVLSICTGHYVTLSCLAKLVNRDSDAFRQQYLKPLAKDGKLKLAFPTAPTHAKQAYRSAE